MKVEIGPYPKYNKKTKKHTPSKRLVKIKIHGYDAWSADDTLALIILPILHMLKKNKQGAPWTEDSDAPGDLRSTAAPAKESEFDVDDNHHKRWDWILDEMIFAFHEIANDNPSEERYHSGVIDWKFEKVEGEYEGQGLSKMVRGPKDTYKLDKAGYEAYHNRIKNGTRLFGVYYQALWD